MLNHFFKRNLLFFFISTEKQIVLLLGDLLTSRLKKKKTINIAVTVYKKHIKGQRQRSHPVLNTETDEAGFSYNMCLCWKATHTLTS